MDDQGPSRQKLSDVFSAAGVIGAWEWDVRRDLFYADAGIFDLFNLARPLRSDGVPIEEMVHGIHPCDRKRVRFERQRSMETGRLHIIDFRAQLTDGTLRALRGRGRFLYDNRGRAIHYVGITMDMSEQLREEKITAAMEACPHALERIADNCIAAHEISENGGYKTLSHILRMAMIEVGTTLAKLRSIKTLDS